MLLRFMFKTILICSVLSLGCSEKPRGGPRLTTTPVTGTVEVDGEAAENLTVECHPEPGAEIKHPVIATTNGDGQFAISMYQKGDGLPEGTYRLTFKWEEFGFPIKDKLKQAYIDPSKSTYKVTVTAGEPNDLGLIELSTKASK